MSQLQGHGHYQGQQTKVKAIPSRPFVSYHRPQGKVMPSEACVSSFCPFWLYDVNTDITGIDPMCITGNRKLFYFL